MLESLLYQFFKLKLHNGYRWGSRGIRRLAAEELGLKTSPYRSAETETECQAAHGRRPGPGRYN
jgi:hypothetical protein